MNVVRWIVWERQKSHFSQSNQQVPGVLLTRLGMTSGRSCSHVFKWTVECSLKDKRGLIHAAAAESTSKVSCRPANHSRDNRKKLSKVFGRRSPFSVMLQIARILPGQCQEWMGPPVLCTLLAETIPSPATSWTQWILVPPETWTVPCLLTLCSTPITKPCFLFRQCDPALLSGAPEVCSSLWSGLSGLTVAVESRIHSRLWIVWLQCFFSCIYNFTFQSLSPSSLIKPATLR